MAKYYFKLFSLPLSFFVTLLSIHVIWRVFDLPHAQELMGQITIWFEAYGIALLFASSIVEGMLLLGGYFPGVFVIFASVVLSDSFSEALFRGGIATAGLLIAHAFNYALGRYGWHRVLERFRLQSSIERSREDVLRKGALAIFGSYWMPSISALTDTAAGILRMPFRKFIYYSFLSTIFWNVLVGGTVYLMGNDALEMISAGGTTEVLVQFSIIAGWMAILFIFDLRRRKKNVPPRG